MEEITNEFELISYIEESIEKGLVQGYKQNIFFTQNYSELQSRVIEYLIVVNVAQALEALAVRYRLQINLEYALNDFYNNAFPSVISSTGIFATDLVRRNNHSPPDSKSRRLDIVITEESRVTGEFFSSFKSFIGIEVKGINQNTKKIEKDIERLAKAMISVDSTGENNIKLCCACFFRRFDKDTTTISKVEILHKIEEEEKRWKAFFTKIESNYQILNFELVPVVIANLPVEDFRFNNPALEYDYSDVLENTGFISAYIIRMTKKEKLK